MKLSQIDDCSKQLITRKPLEETFHKSDKTSHTTSGTPTSGSSISVYISNEIPKLVSNKTLSSDSDPIEKSVRSFRQFFKKSYNSFLQRRNFAKLNFDQISIKTFEDHTKMELSLPHKMVCAGAAACTADIVSFPLDVAKVRLQIASLNTGNGTVAYRGLLGTVLGMVKHEGFQSLYGGISPGLQRQCIFASIRIGLYEPVKGFYTNQLGITSDSASSTMFIRIISAITTGAIGISFAQPTDVVKIKMQAQNKGGPVLYKSSIHAYKKIFASEGLAGLWKGLGANIVRNATVNAAELVCYDSVKVSLIQNGIFQDNIYCHFFSAFAAGFCATVVSSPIDVVKTNFMNSTGGQFKSVLDCARYIANDGGFSAFYRGFWPSFMRLGTWNVVMFVTFEQLKKGMTDYQNKIEPPQELPAKVSKKLGNNQLSPLRPGY